MCKKNAYHKEYTTIYQLGRMTSKKNGQKVTQETAAAVLNVSARQLCAYETGEVKVPDDMVVAMAKYYEMPALVWHHMKYHTVFGEFLPNVPDLKTIGDIVFEGIRTRGKYEKAFDKFLEIAEDGKIALGNKTTLEWCAEEFKNASASLWVMAIGAAQLEIEEEESAASA